eukprot:1719231-Pyramimonas_sp.AAC.1
MVSRLAFASTLQARGLPDWTRAVAAPGGRSTASLPVATHSPLGRPRASECRSRSMRLLVERHALHPLIYWEELLYHLHSSKQAPSLLKATLLGCEGGLRPLDLLCD